MKLTMAVDIKSLRIGSHVAICGGERVKVTCIRSNGIVTTTLGDMDESNLTPIPITPELLKELGFEEERLKYPITNPEVRYIDPKSARRKAEFKPHNEYEHLLPTVTIYSLDKIERPDIWIVRILGGEPLSSSETTVRYLHELEAFLYLTTQTELIND